MSFSTCCLMVKRAAPSKSGRSGKSSLLMPWSLKREESAAISTRWLSVVVISRLTAVNSFTSCAIFFTGRVIVPSRMTFVSV